MTSLSFQLAHSLPEIIMAVGALFLLMLGAFGAGKRDWIITELAIAILGVAILSMFVPIDDKALIWNGAFADDAFARFMKILALGGAMFSLLLSREFMAREGIDFFNFRCSSCWRRSACPCLFPRAISSRFMSASN